MDQIEINGLRVMARHGYTKEEKMMEQEFEIDTILSVSYTHLLRLSEVQKKEDGKVYRVYGYDGIFLGLGVVSVAKGELRILRLFCGEDKV